MPAKPSVKLLYDDPATDSGREHCKNTGKISVKIDKFSSLVSVS